MGTGLGGMDKTPAGTNGFSQSPQTNTGWQWHFKQVIVEKWFGNDQNAALYDFRKYGCAPETEAYAYACLLYFLQIVGWF